MKTSKSKSRAAQKPRTFWLAMPGEEYEGNPVAWQTKELAERSNFFIGADKDNRIMIEAPSEIIKVREVLPKKKARKK